MPFRLGVPELIIILVIVLLIFGAAKLPQVGRSLGEAIREFRKGGSGAGDEQSNKSSETKTTDKENQTKK